uniref:Ig-like domain-containing protein n=1 Tax=Cyprinus carpio TaxID=7962 RepID=A0A8C2ISP7_CYPCA
ILKGVYISNFFFYLVDVLICCQAAVADLLTDLGSNVIINCDLDENEVYWILLKTADPPTVILRSFSTQTKSPFYHNKTFRKKYSVQFKHRLVINNVTADELGFYYCMNTETNLIISREIKLMSYPSSSKFALFYVIALYFTLRYILMIFLMLFLTRKDILFNQKSCLFLKGYGVFTITISLISVSLDVTVEAVFGGSVVLPCSSDEHDLKLQDTEVFWRGKDNEIIYNLIKGADSLKSQEPRYKNRAQTFPDEYRRGNFSIKLVNLTHADAGTYICYITPSNERKTIPNPTCTSSVSSACFLAPMITNVHIRSVSGMSCKITFYAAVSMKHTSFCSHPCETSITPFCAVIFLLTEKHCALLVLIV